MTQEYAVARELLRPEEVEPDAKRVYRQPRHGEQQRHDEQHARHLAATGQIGAHVLRQGGAGAGVQRRVAAPEVGGDAQVADADERDGRRIEQRQQNEVVRVLQRRRLPLLDARPYRHRDDRLDDLFAPHEHARHGRRRRSQPDGADHLPDARATHEGARAQRPVDGVEAFGADDGQREDASRHGQTLAEVDKTAHDVTVDPVLVNLDGDAERHAHEDDHQIAHGQVYQEGVRHRAHVATPGEDTDNEDVADAAEKKRDPVESYEHGGSRVAVHNEVLPDSL